MGFDKRKIGDAPAGNRPPEGVPALQDPCVRAVERTIARWGMAAAGPRLLVAVSGGADSVALLHILRALAPRFHWRLALAHLDHGLRGAASRADAEFVEGLGARLDLPVHRESVDVRRTADRLRLSLEEAGRWERQHFFRALADAHGYTGLALGHHADDNAELMLMRLLRGSGPQGLGGMPPRRPLGEGGPMLIRPLIERRRRDLRAFLQRHGLRHTEDATNRDPRHLRNRIRHHLLPILRADYHPQVETALLRQAEILRDEDAWLRGLAADELARLLRREGEGFLRLDAAALRACPVALQRRVLREALGRLQGDLRHLTFRHVEAVRRLPDAGPDACAALPGGLRARWAEGCLVLEAGGPAVTPAASRARYGYLLPGPGTYVIAEAGLRLDLEPLPGGAGAVRRPAGQWEAFFDMDELSFPLLARNFLAGDRFQPLGVGGSQKLKKYFIDHKVPRHDRDCCPLLVSRQRIIWIAGHRTSEVAKVTPRTRRVLRASIGLPDRV